MAYGQEIARCEYSIEVRGESYYFTGMENMSVCLFIGQKNGPFFTRDTNGKIWMEMCIRDRRYIIVSTVAQTGVDEAVRLIFLDGLEERAALILFQGHGHIEPDQAEIAVVAEKFLHLRVNLVLKAEIEVLVCGVREIPAVLPGHALARDMVGQDVYKRQIRLILLSWRSCRSL